MITPKSTLRRLPLVSSEALTDGQVLVGDFVVKLGVRQGTRHVGGQ